MATLTNQLKEDIIFWFDQNNQITEKKKNNFNPVDKLGKFDLDKEQPDKWIEHTNRY